MPYLVYLRDILMLTYRWCYTAQDNSKWEYCSPPSQVACHHGDRHHDQHHHGLVEFAGDGKEGYIHHIWPGVHWRLWNTWREILVKTKIFPVKIFLLTLLEPVFLAVP